RWALINILIVACYAALVEYHQSFVPGRTAAVGDVLIDTTGGIAAQLVASLFVLLAKARDQRHKDERKAAGAAPINTAKKKSNHKNGDSDATPFIASLPRTHSR